MFLHKTRLPASATGNDAEYSYRYKCVGMRGEERRNKKIPERDDDVMDANPLSVVGRSTTFNPWSCFLTKPNPHEQKRSLGRKN